MLYQTVLIKWCEEKIQAEQCEPTLICNIDDMSGPTWKVRLQDDSVIDVHVGQTVSIEVLDEDDHHEFVNEFTFARKETTMMELASHVLETMDGVIQYCPEDRDTLMEQLLININALKQAEKDSE